MIMKNPYVVDSKYVSILGNKLKEMDSFSYPGTTISSDGDCNLDIKRRKALARVPIKNLNKSWKDKYISITTKLRIFSASVLLMLS